MQIIKIQGGLGNQMFQYAYGRNLEISGKKVIFDTSFFDGGKAKIDTARNFKLDKFAIETRSPFLEKRNISKTYINRIKRRLRLKVEEFFQSEKYFKGIEETIRKEFTLKNPLNDATRGWLEQIKNSRTSVSLHIRRGDYVSEARTNAYHGVCGLDYYQKAYEVIKTKTNSPLDIFVFSDDIEWVEENLKLPAVMYFVSNSSIPDYEEMFLMSTCNNHIIANSSFSWWGAWLDPNPDKIIIAPKKWFANDRQSSEEIVPSTWIKI